MCVESFNKSSRIRIKCVCGYECCRECCREYMLSKKDDVGCMSCKVVWSREFLVESLGRSFMVKEYKGYREELLVEREMGMLQATQPYVEREIKMEKLDEEIKRVRDEYERKLRSLEGELRELKTNDEIVEKKKFIRKCPNGDCHGFLSSGLKCELCGCRACSECREVKLENHECNKDILESVRLLEKDSKGCPKCSALIFKIEGCDQMYCVECHTAFSWRTLKIETGVIHNPHFFEYQRRMNNGVAPRNPLDVQCGRELDNNFVVAFMDRYNPLPNGWRREVRYGVVMYYNPSGRIVYNAPSVKDKEKDYEKVVSPMLEICRQVIHVRHVEQPRFVVGNRLTNNLKLRIDYMRNKITRDDMKKTLQKREKENLKRTEIGNVLGMYVSCMTDLFYRLYEEGNMSGIKREMNQLKKYVNECLTKVSKTYNCKEYKLDEQFRFN